MNKKKIIRYIKILGILALLFAIFKGVFILFLLIALSFSMSFVVNTLNLRSIGLELVTFVAVLSGMKYGPWIGLLISLVLISYHMLAGGFFANYLMWVIPAYSLAGLIAGFFPATDVTTLGIYVTFGININNTIWTALTSPGYLPKYMIFVVTNIVFNMLLFSLFAKTVLLLLI